MFGLLWDDYNKDERDWQELVEKQRRSRKRQRSQKEDEAVVASFFNHVVDDPFASQIVELLLDHSVVDSASCRRQDDSNSENDVNKKSASCKQEVLTRTTDDEEMQDQDCNGSNGWEQHKRNYCHARKEDLDDEDATTTTSTHSEPTTTSSITTPMMSRPLSTIWEVSEESERTVRTGSCPCEPSSLETSSDDESHHPQEELSTKTKRKGVNKTTAGIMESLARNVKQLLPTSPPPSSGGKENNNNILVVEDVVSFAKSSPKISERLLKKRSSSLHNLSKNIRRLPLQEKHQASSSSKPRGVLLASSRRPNSVAR